MAGTKIETKERDFNSAMDEDGRRLWVSRTSASSVRLFGAVQKPEREAGLLKYD